jgi:hypothetical protein
LPSQRSVPDAKPNDAQLAPAKSNPSHASAAIELSRSQLSMRPLPHKSHPQIGAPGTHESASETESPVRNASRSTSLPFASFSVLTGMPSCIPSFELDASIALEASCSVPSCSHEARRNPRTTQLNPENRKKRPRTLGFRASPPSGIVKAYRTPAEAVTNILITLTQGGLHTSM